MQFNQTKISQRVWQLSPNKGKLGCLICWEQKITLLDAKKTTQLVGCHTENLPYKQSIQIRLNFFALGKFLGEVKLPFSGNFLFTLGNLFQAYLGNFFERFGEKTQTIWSHSQQVSYKNCQIRKRINVMLKMYQPNWSPLQKKIEP